MPGPLVGLAVRGAGMALRGVGKALMKGGKSLTKAGSKKSQAQRKKFRRRRKSTNDPALSTALTFTGAAGAGLLGKKIMDDRKKNRTGGR